MNKKIIFFGTNDISIGVLKILITLKNIKIFGCFVKKKKNGIYVEIKNFCKNNNLPFFLINDDSEILEIIKNNSIDIGISCSYGSLFTKKLLNKITILNIHFSLLPKYRGASPVESAVLNNESIIGISLIKTCYELDAGDIIFTSDIKIKKIDYIDGIYKKIFINLKKNLNNWIINFFSNNFVYKKQSQFFSMTKKFKKDFFLLNFNDSALKIMNMVRAFAYRKKIFFKIKKNYFFIYKCEIIKCEQSVPKKYVNLIKTIL